MAQGDLAAPGPEPDAAADGDVDAESPGWFREEPLGEDGSAPGDVTRVELEWDAEGTPDSGPRPEPEPESDVALVVRERDRPVVMAAPIVEGPPRQGRFRRFLIGVATIAIVAAAGFVAGLMLPVVLPGPGISTGSPSPSAAATPVPTAAGGPTTEPSIAPSATPSPQPTPEPTPAPTPVIYVVKRGDLLSRIASTYGVTVAAIQEANSIENPNLIRVGQKLIIPLPVVSPAP
jgi:LysM repeat protein